MIGITKSSDRVQIGFSSDGEEEERGGGRNQKH